MLNIENTSDEQILEAIAFREWVDMMEQWANERSEYGHDKG